LLEEANVSFLLPLLFAAIVKMFYFLQGTMLLMSTALLFKGAGKMW